MNLHHSGHRSLGLLCFVALLTGPRIEAQNAKAILTNVAKAYRELSNYRMEGRTITETIISGQKSKSEVRFVVAYETPNKFRIEYRYPDAGTWVRVSDGITFTESRSLDHEFKQKSATAATLRVLRSSPLEVFEHLTKTARYPVLMRSEAVNTKDGPVDCYLIGFESQRRPLRKNEWPGPSMVWVDKKNYLVLREDIRRSSVEHGVLSENRTVTEIEVAQINHEIPRSLLSP